MREQFASTYPSQVFQILGTDGITMSGVEIGGAFSPNHFIGLDDNTRLNIHNNRFPRTVLRSTIRFRILQMHNQHGQIPKWSALQLKYQNVLR